ncbi:Uu.00g023060.m01.CDS01 [Anthostomella pinea]|uniref:Uu.00g023060.m01.CDS01 n=1 Tax=Anthostomella pinea TaxID=933095 RepID=A0AAI8VZY9_9PEZI|nr:Uu.00g023060.m01.CDS01 [Anthostomella pinea]
MARTDSSPLRPTEDIFADHRLLKKIVSQHSEALHRRWNGYHTRKKHQVLQGVWPTMPARHRPDLKDFLTRNQTKNEDLYLWPNINMEDLSNGDNMLLMLHSRSARPRELLLKATIGQGMMILKVQERVYSFLLDICKSVLHDMPLFGWDELGKDSSTTPMVPSKDNRNITKLHTLKLEAPYRLPEDMDLSGILSITAATLDEATEKIIAMREEPEFFGDTLDQVKDHRREMIGDGKGIPHPIVKLPAEEFWESVVAEAVTSSLEDVWRWDAVHRLLTRLKDSWESFCGTDDPTSQLPSDFAKDVLVLHRLLTDHSEYLLRKFAGAIFASPPLRHHYVRTGSVKQGIIEAVSDKSLEGDAAAHALVNIVNYLIDDDIRSMVGLPAFIDELDHFRRREKGTKKLFSSLVDQYIEHLAILSKVHRQMDRLPRWVTQALQRIFRDDRAKYIELFRGQITQLDSIREGKIWAQVASLGVPTNGRFTYPVGRKYTTKKVHALQAAEKNLALFWSSFIRLYKKASGPSDRIILTLDEAKLLQIPDWSEPSVGAGSPPVERFQLGRDISSAGESKKEKKQKQREKEEAAREARGAEEPPDVQKDAPGEAQRQEEEPAFFVDKRAFEILQQLFTTPKGGRAGGEVP